MTLIGQQVTVLGAGIAGLAVALALAMRGARVTVLEQADAIREVGAGLQISPNGAVVLQALGLGGDLARLGVRARAVELRDAASGGRVLRLDLARHRPDHGYFFVHRADLIALLADAARKAGVAIRFGQRVEIVTLAEAPELQMADGSGITPPLLVGADGLHSPVRAALNGRVVPFFTRQAAWRAVIAAEPGAAPEASVFMAPGRHLVSYPLRGGTLRNIVAVEERLDWVEEGWHRPDDPAHLRAAFAGFGGPVPGWLARVEEAQLWGLFRHPVARRWHGQGAVVLGDAAHPTLPFLAQGANMALEDAWVLAACLAGHDTTDAAFAAYQALREARVTRIVTAANRNARNYHLRGAARLVAHLGLKVIGALAPALPLQRFDWLYDFDATKP